MIKIRKPRKQGSLGSRQRSPAKIRSPCLPVGQILVPRDGLGKSSLWFEDVWGMSSWDLELAEFEEKGLGFTVWVFVLLPFDRI